MRILRILALVLTITASGLLSDCIVSKPQLAHAQSPSMTLVGLAWSPDGTKIVGGGTDGVLRIWDGSGQLLLAFGSITEDIWAVAWSPDGTKIATGGTDQLVKIWNVQAQSEELVATLVGHQDSIRSLAWSPDGKYIVSVARNEFNTMQVWDGVAFNSKPLAQYPVSNLLGVEWRPDGATVALASEVGIFFFDDIFQINLAELGEYLYGAFIITPVIAWNGDGTQLVAGDLAGRVYVLDSLTKTILDTFTPHTDAITGLSWNSVGNVIASAGVDNAIIIWDVRTGEIIEQIDALTIPLTLAWSPDGQSLAFGDADGEVNIIQPFQ